MSALSWPSPAQFRSKGHGGVLPAKMEHYRQVYSWGRGLHGWCLGLEGGCHVRSKGYQPHLPQISGDNVIHQHISAEMCCDTEAGSYLRLIDSCITQLKVQGPSRTCNESKEEEEADVWRVS